MLTKRRVMWATIATAVLGLAMTGVLVARPPQAPAQATARAAHAATAGTITINASLGETFAPAPPSAAPALTAEQAWRQYAELARSSVTTIPSDVTARLGLFTLPVGPAFLPGTSRLPKSHGEAYTALNQLAYGYSWHSCPAYVGGPGMRPPPRTPCIEWLFLDAGTGQQIEETWQT